MLHLSLSWQGKFLKILIIEFVIHFQFKLSFHQLKLRKVKTNYGTCV